MSSKFLAKLAYCLSKNSCFDSNSSYKKQQHKLSYSTEKKKATNNPQVVSKALCLFLTFALISMATHF